MLSLVFSLRTIHLDPRHSLSATYFADQQEHHPRHYDGQELKVSVRVILRRSFNLSRRTLEQHRLYGNDDTFHMSENVVVHSFAMGEYEDHLQLMVQLFNAFPMIAAGKSIAYQSYEQVVRNEIHNGCRRGSTALDLVAVIDYQIDILEVTPALRARYQDEYRMSGMMMAMARDMWYIEISMRVAAATEADSENMPASSTEFSMYLERFLWKAVDANDEQCVVCLEQFVPNESQVACMPCKHVFHDLCITNWLRLNHSCPLCRFVPDTVLNN